MKIFKSKTEKLRDKIEYMQLKQEWEAVKPHKETGKPKTVCDYNEREYRSYLRGELYGYSSKIEK